ncbi:MAG: type I methionyl aminopeptidase [Lachnospiraceae bacterium]|nr:type I methionyl aminopeptidase [Lachnospiraceae bacterium]
MITIKSEHEIELMRTAGLVLAKVHKELEQYVKPGISTFELDRICEKLIRGYGCIPSFKGYDGFPASACMSVNEEVVHGIPSHDRVLQEGDIISIDTGTIYKGWQSDAARTHAVGRISGEARDLIDHTRESFFEGIKVAVAGNHVNDIGRTIEDYISQFGYGIVEDLVGHGIGQEMHEEPEVPNFTCARRGIRLRKNMTIAVEPMINMGTWEVVESDNGWTYVTADGQYSAHYENTLLIREGEPEVLSLLPEEKQFYGVK